MSVYIETYVLYIEYVYICRCIMEGKPRETYA